ncbi:hypothetical protein EIN_086650 [Entamoeba invadens IP1]|uniref:hypothetical protein n=1 Tax=Entamoeba invadens IP1 TaxID=370355 RepID=UPI0002C3D3B9|nr:hypothetical protein EIN_086650 [Entamoeba invadens IP1]ELP85383.1 hypothetical protein EIN_086650 [Entamoeba invadens IP1]|eukprot:XP_004184729.1 hypothetical protein EIN_086650 [Entamoeba invadens IP1]
MSVRDRKAGDRELEKNPEKSVDDVEDKLNEKIVKENENTKIVENKEDNPMAHKPLLDRFEDGVLKKFAIFTFFMFAVPFLIYYSLHNAFGDVMTIVLCLFSTIGILLCFIMVAFNEKI